MTKPELIDAVKRWQVAEYLYFCDYWPITVYQEWLSRPAMWYTKTFLALLQELEPDVINWLVTDGKSLPVDFSFFPKVTIRNITEPGVGFGGVDYGTL